MLGCIRIESDLTIRTVAAVGVAAIAALQKIHRGKDDPRPLVIKILRPQPNSRTIFLTSVVVVLWSLRHG